MQLLAIPYLYFKDFGKSSGVIHQSQILKALADVNFGITVLLPKKSDGWVYDAHEFFAHDRITVHEIAMAKDQHMWSGFWTDEMYRVLSPMRSPVLFDAVLNFIPHIAGGVKRLLAETGFAKFPVPVINVFDTVTVKAEHNVRGGNLLSFLETAEQMEVFGALAADASILTTHHESLSLKANISGLLAPSVGRDLMKKVHYVPKPLRLNAPMVRLRPLEGPWRVFMGRSFGRSHEEGGKDGEQVASVVNAIAKIAATRQVEIVLCTRSEWDSWCEETVSVLPPGVLELHHDKPREEILKVMQTCHFGVDLRDYDGLYMAALEQQASGLVTLTKPSVWSQGEIAPLLTVTSYKPDGIAEALLYGMQSFESLAAKAMILAIATLDRHLPFNVGMEMREIVMHLLQPLYIAPSIEKLMKEWEDLYRGQTMSFADAKKSLLKLTKTGSLGRYPDSWLMRAMRWRGADVIRVGGLEHSEVRVGVL